MKRKESGLDRRAAEAAAVDEVKQRPTVSIPTAGLALGLGINKAYECARNGLIPTLDFGGEARVPTPPLRRMLGLDQQAA